MRLIDADKTIGHIKTRLLETALNNCDAVCDASYLYTECADNRIETWIDEIPTVEAEPTRHGHWIFNPKDAIEMMFTLPKCSECGAESPNGGNYCSNCGAKML